VAHRQGEEAAHNITLLRISAAATAAGLDAESMGHATDTGELLFTSSSVCCMV
jgi:hypothetical protein